MATVPFVLGRAEYQILGGKHYLIMYQNQERSGGSIRYNVFKRDITVNGLFSVEGKPKCILHNLDNLLQPLASVPYSRKQVVPTEWQVQTVLRDCKAKAKVISIQAPQYQQYALISEILD